MASIRYRNNKWQARVIRKGHVPVARSFLTKQDAECNGLINCNT